MWYSPKSSFQWYFTRSYVVNITAGSHNAGVNLLPTPRMGCGPAGYTWAELVWKQGPTCSFLTQRPFYST